MIGRAALGSSAARCPLVVKLTTDEAYERARRRSLVDVDMDAFQEVDGDLRVLALRGARNVALSRAVRVICPSAYLRQMAVRWGVPEERALVIPNPAPDLPELPSHEEARKATGIEGPLLAFAGRIGRQKALEVGLAAVAASHGVTLMLAGDGPERDAMESRAAELGLGERVRFMGALDRRGVLELFRAADVSLLSSSWENFPHTVVESLAVGTPVISTAVGGVPEVVTDGENGLLVPAGNPDALAAAIGRFFGEPGLRERLAAATVGSVAGHGREEILSRIEAVLLEAAA
jgi:glycosyltransferase involved in cell wall biosynthesis